MTDFQRPLADEDAVLRFERKRVVEDEVDMTPMIDCVFLLLIFFLVTASFALQKALEVPPPEEREKDAAVRSIEEVESDDDYVIVRIDRDNTIWVNDSEAPSEQDLLLKLREARQTSRGAGGQGPSNLLVLADGDARHETVIRALDAGNAVGMEHVRLATADDIEM